MYTIKQIPEDFIVKEISKPKLQPNGRYAYFILKKIDYTTLKAIQTICRYLNVPLKFIGFAGTKDKKAITEQLISISSKYIQKLKQARIKDIHLRFIGQGDEPLSLGDLEGNEFTITIRDLDQVDQFKKKDRFLNLFGEQRFSKNNADIGRSIIKRDFNKAIELILENEVEYKSQIEEKLKDSPNDSVGALKTIPKKLIMMYIHSYQSKLWNKAAEQLKDEKENMNLPIVGFGTDIEEIKDERVRGIISKIAKEESITQRDFIIRELQNLSPEGNERELFAEIKNLRVIEKDEDEINKGKKKIKISFFLKKASYATEAIKSMIE